MGSLELLTLAVVSFFQMGSESCERAGRKPKAAAHKQGSDAEAKKPDLQSRSPSKAATHSSLNTKKANQGHNGRLPVRSTTAVSHKNHPQAPAPMTSMLLRVLSHRFKLLSIFRPHHVACSLVQLGDLCDDFLQGLFEHQLEVISGRVLCAGLVQVILHTHPCHVPGQRGLAHGGRVPIVALWPLPATDRRQQQPGMLVKAPPCDAFGVIRGTCGHPALDAKAGAARALDDQARHALGDSRE